MTRSARTLTGFSVRLFGVALLVAAAAIGAMAPARAQSVELAQAGRPAKGPALPFEADFAQRRHDHAVLSFNDHIATVPGNRIRDVPVVNGRMGDRVIVGEGTSLYFPVGYLMTATYRFDKLRPKAGVVSVGQASDLEPNPDYALVRHFDAELGPVCAVTEDKTSHVRVEFRIKPGTKVMSLVLDQPGLYDAIAKDTSRSYAVFSGTEERYVVNDALARKLLTHCKSGSKDITVAHDGSPIGLAMLTGTDGTQK
jgi:hypothetical protein